MFPPRSENHDQPTVAAEDSKRPPHPQTAMPDPCGQQRGRLMTLACDVFLPQALLWAPATIQRRRKVPA